MISVRAPRLPMAVVALAAILVITAGWWTLALWPLGPAAADWVVRTRLVCFGASHTGLPNAGGWLLLIGEPIGMLAVLHLVWHDELRRGLRELHRHVLGRVATVSVGIACVIGVYAAGLRVTQALSASTTEAFAVATPLPKRGTAPAPPLRLIDQYGAVTDLQTMRGQWVMVTFAFGHCADICPIIVQNATRARQDEQALGVPLLVVTLDPWRDTPDRLPSLVTAWQLSADDRVLSGRIEHVNAALDDWHIARTRDTITGDVLHGSTIVVVDPEGRAAWRIEGAPLTVRQALRLAMADQAEQRSAQRSAQRISP